MSPEPPELEIELELRRLGSSAFARYRPPPPPFSLDLEPHGITDPFPSLPHSFCSRERPEPPTPEAPPPRDLVLGELGCFGDHLHHHPNGDIPLSPTVPPARPLVPCSVAGELADLSTARLEMTGGAHLSSSPLPRPHPLGAALPPHSRASPWVADGGGVGCPLSLLWFPSPSLHPDLIFPLRAAARRRSGTSGRPATSSTPLFSVADSSPGTVTLAYDTSRWIVKINQLSCCELGTLSRVRNGLSRFVERIAYIYR